MESRRHFVKKAVIVLALASPAVRGLEAFAGTEDSITKSNAETRKRILPLIYSKEGRKYVNVGALSLEVVSPSSTKAPGEYVSPFENGVPLIALPKEMLDLNVTPNFKLREFAYIPSPSRNQGTGIQTYEHAGKTYHAFIRLDPQLPEELQQLRESFGPLEIISPFRNVTYNRKISKAASKSRHVAGQAADVTGSNVKRIYELANTQFSNGGVGYYPGSKGNFVHVDTRGFKERW